MKANQTSSRENHHKFFSFGIYRHLLASVLALIMFSEAPAAFAESHYAFPNVTVNGSTQSVAVDSGWHLIFTVDTSSQVQITYFSNGAWQNAHLSGQPVKPGKLLYVDSVWHFLYYVGNNNHIWAWYFNGSVWTNVELFSALFVNNLVGVDSSAHLLWFEYIGSLYALYYNGSAWAELSSGVGDFASNYGGVVNDSTHALYWLDTGGANGPTNSLRALYLSPEGFVSAVLPPASSFNAQYSRPAVRQGTPGVYADLGQNGNLYRIFPLFKATYDAFSSDSLNGGYASIAVKPTDGKVIFCNYYGGAYAVAVITPNAGLSYTWPRTSVSGTTGHIVKYCAMDNQYGWYVYTILNGTLHIVY